MPELKKTLFSTSMMLSFTVSRYKLMNSMSKLHHKRHTSKSSITASHKSKPTSELRLLQKRRTKDAEWPRPDRRSRRTN